MSATAQQMTILVPVDGSALADQAIAYAGAIATSGDDVILLHVAPLPEPQHDKYGHEFPMTDDELGRLDEAAKGVTARSRKLWNAVVPNARELLERGDPAEHIIRIAAKEHVDLIVMASHGRGALGRWRYGSVTDRVARTANMPVMVIRPKDAYEGYGAARIHRFVVPLDGSDLANRAVPVARCLAKRLHKQIHLVRVTPDATMSVSGFGATIADSAAQDAAEAAKTAAVASLKQAASELEAQGISTTWDVEEGDAYSRITCAAGRGDVIVLASHGRSGPKRWLLGSVAEKLIRLAEVPTIVVRAGGP